MDMENGGGTSVGETTRYAVRERSAACDLQKITEGKESLYRSINAKERG